MWLSDEWKDYEVIDTSSGEKLERWGKYILVRPDPQVIWTTPKNHPLWRKYDARYSAADTIFHCSVSFAAASSTAAAIIRTSTFFCFLVMVRSLRFANSNAQEHYR